MGYRVLAALVVLALTASACGLLDRGSARFNLNDMADPVRTLVKTEVLWRADLERRGDGATVHPDARCYFNLSRPDGAKNGQLDATRPIMCGPVAHWVGRVEPTVPITPTEHYDGVDWYVFPDYVPPYAHGGKWDAYVFQGLPTTAEGELWPVRAHPVTFGIALQDHDRDQLWHPSGPPPTDMGDNLTHPTDPPPRGEVEPPARVDLDINYRYQPDTYTEGDLTATYAIEITDGVWQASGAPPERRELRLTVDSSAVEVADGYELAASAQGAATARTDDGTEARSINEGQTSRHTVGPDQPHPDLVFHLPSDTDEVAIELSPNLQFTRIGDDALDPATGVVQHPPKRFTLQLADS